MIGPHDARSTPQAGLSERLTQSRKALAAYLRGQKCAHLAAAASSPKSEPGSTRWPGMASLFSWALGAMPTGSITGTAMHLAGNVAHGQVSTLARRHPWALLGSGLLLGGLLVLARPWRLLLRPALVTNVLIEVIARALRASPAARP